MVENDTAAVGSTGKYVSEHAFGMIDTHLPKIAHWMTLLAQQYSGDEAVRGTTVKYLMRIT